MKKQYLLYAIPLLAMIACKNVDPNPEPETEPPVTVEGEGETPDYDPETIPSFDYEIAPYGGETATDMVSYQDGNPDLNPEDEDNDWSKVVTVEYSGSTVAINPVTGVSYTVVGADVELKLGQVKNVKVVVSGTSDNGSLTLTGYYKHMIELDNLTLTSTDRPAINDKIDKRMFLMLTGKSKIEDGEDYEYKTSKRKGCFYAASHVILCGSGVLEVKGNNRHGFATDGFLFVNPGSTLVVTDAKKNAIHVDGAGSNNSYRGIEVTGGYIYAHTSAPAGKAMKCDGRIALRGGKLSLNASGNAAVDDDGLLSSPGCLKSDSTVYISGGEILLTATGQGAKGISADFDVNIDGGSVKIANAGTSTSNGSDNSTAKAITANQNIAISAGGIYLSAIGSGAMAFSADAGFTMTDGVVYAFGANYGVEALSGKVTGGTFLCGGTQNTSVTGVTVSQYGHVEAESVTVLTDDNGNTAAAFRWPIDLITAQLLSK